MNERVLGNVVIKKRYKKYTVKCEGKEEERKNMQHIRTCVKVNKIIGLKNKVCTFKID